MADLITRVERNILSRHLLKPREKLLVAVSGGLDSIVLLNLLHRLSALHGWSLFVGHFNHQLRGRSSDADERFVRESGTRLRVPVFTDRANVKAFATRAGISTEMAARRLRHEFLARTARRNRLAAIALAHHADDQVELFFLRLFRGAGGEGLGGMKWAAPSPVDSTVRLIRPLLDIAKVELEQFARDETIGFREDATNTHLNFERNRIRHELLPMLRRKFSSTVDKTILRAMEIIGAEADFAAAAARSWLQRKASSKFDALEVAVQRRVVQALILDHGIVPDFDLIERLRAEDSRPTTVGPGRLLWRDADGSIHEKRETKAKEFNPQEIVLPLSGRDGRASMNGCNISWTMRNRSGRAPFRLRGLPGREYFDAEKIGSSVRLRHWRRGDRFQPIGMSKPVKLQDWFINQKVPRSTRHELILATTEAGEIFWVEGGRIGDRFRVTAETSHLLSWRWSRNSNFRSNHSH